MSSGSLGLRQEMLERLARTNGITHERSTMSARRRAEELRRMHRVTIFIVDADEIVRLGVRTMLSGERDFAVVGESDSIARMTSQAASVRPMIAIVAGPPLDGGVLDACRQLKAATPDVRVIILARDVNAVSVIEAVRAGAAAYFTKRIGRADLCRSVRAVAMGEVLIDPTSTRVLLEGIRQGVGSITTPDVAPLAVQERRVLALVAQGKTNKEIAAELSLSDKTVKNYLSHAFEKLNVTRRAHAAVLFAQINGPLRPAI